MEAAELYARSMAAQAWEDACDAQKQSCADQFLDSIEAKVRQPQAKEYCIKAPKPINPYKP